MNDKKDGKSENISQELFEMAVKEVVKEVSSNVQKSYKIVDLSKVPDHVSYSKIEKYLRSVNIEITRKMFLSYLKEELLPGGHEVKNANFSYYTKEQVIYYILVDMFKPILSLHKIKTLFNTTLKPMIDDKGVECTYKILDTIIYHMIQKFEEATVVALNENISTIEDIEQYTSLVTLCMTRGALDFYENSSNKLSSSTEIDSY